MGNLHNNQKSTYCILFSFNRVSQNDELTAPFHRCCVQEVKKGTHVQLCTGYRESQFVTSHPASLSCCLRFWNKREYQDPSQLILLHILFGGFAINISLLKPHSTGYRQKLTLTLTGSNESSKHDTDGWNDFGAVNKENVLFKMT